MSEKEHKIIYYEKNGDTMESLERGRWEATM
jgi:hypothetical protein